MDGVNRFGWKHDQKNKQFWQKITDFFSLISHPTLKFDEENGYGIQELEETKNIRSILWPKEQDITDESWLLW